MSLLIILPYMNKFCDMVSDELRLQSVMKGDHYYVLPSRSSGRQQVKFNSH